MAQVRGPAKLAEALLAALLISLLLALSGALLLMQQQQPQAFAQHLVNGLTLGALFALIALGYTMVYGIIELINFAHGEVFMLGSFLGLLALQALFGWGITSVFVAPVLALLVAMCGCAALGVALDAVAYKPLRRKPNWASVLAACGAILGLTIWLLPGRGKLDLGLLDGAEPYVFATRLGGFVILLLMAWTAFQLDAKNPSAPRTTPRVNALLSAIGMSIFLQNLVMLAVGRDTQTFIQITDFSGLPVNPETGLSRSSFPLFGIEVQYIEVVTLVAALLLMVALDILVSKTALGRAMRAIAQDPEAARMLGIPVARIITATFMLGSALAAAAGILYGLRYGGVKFNDGFIIGLKAFIAAVLGGIGNIRGAMLGGFLLGLSETVVVATMEFGWQQLGNWRHGDKVTELWPHAEFHDYKDAIAFLVLVAVLTLRPAGLLGVPEVEKV
ncbi:MAG: hypothetical protein CMP23_14180 [Rickettsiales bacterium]|nr:hypothetical protein [Rickettsiales bacterium]